jgi:hypothetical protein
VENGATVLKGIVRGRTIELERAVNLPDGQEGRVVLHPAGGDVPVVPGEGVGRSFGGWAGDEADELDQYLQWNRERRKQSRRENEG